MSRRARRRLRVVGVVAFVAGALLFALPAVEYVKPFLDETSVLNRSNYYGAIIGVIGLFLAVIPAAWAMIKPPKDLDLISELRHEQKDRTSTALEQLQVGLPTDIQIFFAAPNGPKQTVEDLARAVVVNGERLCIVGPLGSGKSYAAARLVLCAMSLRSDLVPLIIPVSSWHTETNMHDWLVKHIQRQLTISKALAARLLVERRLLPIFDSLDQALTSGPDGYADELATTFMRTLLAWQEQAHPAPFILTTRSDAWNALPREVKDNYSLTFVRVRRVPPEDAGKFVSRSLTGTNSSQITDQIHEAISTGQLADIWGIPWGLAQLIRIAEKYKEADGSLSLTGQNFLRTTDRVGLTWEFIHTSTFLTGSFLPEFRQRLVLRWLSNFARYLAANDGERIVSGERLSPDQIILHRLWPVAGTLAPRLADFAMCLILSIPGLVWLFQLVWPLGPVGRISLILATAFYGYLLVRTSMRPWVVSASFAWDKVFRPRYAVRQTLFALLIGVVSGVLFGRNVGLSVGVTCWVVVGFTVGFGQTLAVDAEAEVLGPLTVLRQEHLISRLSAWSVLPILMLGFGATFGAPIGWFLAIGYCAITGETVACALWRRYVAMLLLQGHRVGPFPGRLWSFAVRTGIGRTSGIAFEFRHRDVRDCMAAWAARDGSGAPDRRGKAIAEAS